MENSLTAGTWTALYGQIVCEHHCCSEGFSRTCRQCQDVSRIDSCVPPQQTKQKCPQACNNVYDINKSCVPWQNTVQKAPPVCNNVYGTDRSNLYDIPAKGLKLLHLNTCHLYPHLPVITLVMSMMRKKPEILGFSETF